MKRTITALALGLGLALTSSPASGAEMLKSYPTCSKAWLTNGGAAHETCQMTATHHETGTKRWPVLVTFTEGCHLATWRTEGNPGPTKDEGIRMTCWENGRFVTYYI